MQTARLVHSGSDPSSGGRCAAARRAKSKGPFGHVCRLISFLDALYYVGDFLYRKSLRYSGATAAVCLLGYLGNFLPGVETYPARVAIVLPLVVGSTTLLSGLVLKNLPNLFFTRLTNVAQAADLDLMEDYRKSQQEEHLAALWQRVFRHEWAIESKCVEIHPHPVECPPSVVSDVDAPSDRDARARFQFMRRAHFALDHHQSQPRQHYHLGIDLRFLEDWRNGGYFDRNDVKLIEQFEASAVLADVKREAGHGKWVHLASLPRRVAQRFWTGMITRAIGVQIGEALTWLNRKYHTDGFNAQAILWPGEEHEPWLAQFPGARDDLLERRRMLITRVFGKDSYDGRRMLERMVLPSFLSAVHLRACFDPEYLDGSLDHTAVGDLEAASLEPRRIQPYRELTEQADRDRHALGDYLRTTRRELLTPENAEALRAVRIAVHVNRHGLRRLLRQFVAQPERQASLLTKIAPVVDRAVQDRYRLTRLLIGLRVHHELTRLHSGGYLDLLDALRRSCEASSVPAPAAIEPTRLSSDHTTLHSPPSTIHQRF